MPSAAILTGGRASRFGGRDKGALLVDGQSILARQLAALTRLTDEVMLVGRGEPSDLPRIAGVRVRYVADRFDDCGPLAGLDAALAEAQADPVVILACDMPFVTGELLARLAILSASPAGSTGDGPGARSLWRAAPAARKRQHARRVRGAASPSQPSSR